MLFDRLPDRVTIYEVSPRDGLQNESALLDTASKVQLVHALVEAGLSRVEVTSFVSPKWIPQLADAEALIAALLPDTQGPRARYSALCPNARGLSRVLPTALREIAVFVSASEEHNQKNLNHGIAETLAAMREVVQDAKATGLHVRGCISTVWGFRSEHDVELPRVAEIGRALLAMGCDELSLGDTVGLATPKRVRDCLKMLLSEHPPETLSMHMHDTRGTALANVVVGLELGLRAFDAAIGGLGGCPYAPGAAGNLATEDLVYMLLGMGIETGIDLDKLIAAGNVAAALVGHDLPGKVHRAALAQRTMRS
ncbi:MAG: Hydroxymethylglutaryl-CoA lyase [Myxococcaceae bacterium]|nr:Hydroxymethylglutaryl-CoA lyase [Myxococcaceae bacterium]